MTELPTSFGKYFLTEKLATGGMAEIYLAKIVGPGGFEKQLVIKQIHPKLTGQRHFVDLFVTEAKTLVTLAHGNIVPVYELGVLDDTYFIAMEYIDGPTLYRLTEILARRDARMDPALAAWITARILEGLDYAHRKGDGVIHRDLSPRNVMLSRDGEVKLVDFGIAVTLGADDAGAAAQSAPTGSFPYMSPEQVRREPLTVQTDLFSAGVLCWEMLVGHRLFARRDPEATLAAVVGAEIARPSHERPEIPARLDEVVMRALERDRAARWGSAGEMLAALQRYLYALEVTPGPRDLTALVARFCPPETRRIPTHADHPPFPDDDGAAPPAPSGPRTAVMTTRAGHPPYPDDDGAAPPAPSGPRTAVIPRDAAVGGKRRARTETFATNVEMKHMLERATPLFPIAAIRDGEAAAGHATGSADATEAEAASAAGAAPAGRVTTAPIAAESASAAPHAAKSASAARAAAAPHAAESSSARATAVPHAAESASAARAARAAAVPHAAESASAARAAAAPHAAESASAAAHAAESASAARAADSAPPIATTGAEDAVAPARSVARMASIRPDAIDVEPVRPTDPALPAREPPPSSLPIPGRTPPSGGVLVAAALGTLALGAIAIYVFMSGRATVLAPDAARSAPVLDASLPEPTADAPPPADAAALDAPSPAPPDAGVLAPPRDAAARPRDAAELIDAAPRVRPDAGTPPIDAPARPAGNGTLRIGADPWGEIVIDGTPRGRTPQELVLPAGRHVVDVVFRGEDPPRKKSFQINLGVGEILPLQVDFTAP